MVKLINPERSSGLAEPQSSDFTNKVLSPIRATSSALPEEKALQFDEANNGCNNPPLLGNLNLGTADEASLLAADDDSNPFSPKGPNTTQNPLLPFEALGRRTPSPLEHAQRGDSQAEEEKDDEEHLHAHPIFPEEGPHQPRLSLTEKFVGTILHVGREILNTPVLEVQQNNETTRQRRKRRLSDPGAPSPTAGAGPTRITDKWWLY